MSEADCREYVCKLPNRLDHMSKPESANMEFDLYCENEYIYRVKFEYLIMNDLDNRIYSIYWFFVWIFFIFLACR